MASTTRTAIPAGTTSGIPLVLQARIKIYPDSAPGVLFQHYVDFAADVEAFLSEPAVVG